LREKIQLHLEREKKPTIKSDKQFQPEKLIDQDLEVHSSRKRDKKSTKTDLDQFIDDEDFQIEQKKPRKATSSFPEQKKNTRKSQKLPPSPIKESIDVQGTKRKTRDNDQLEDQQKRKRKAGEFSLAKIPSSFQSESTASKSHREGTQPKELNEQIDHVNNLIEQFQVGGNRIQEALRSIQTLVQVNFELSPGQLKMPAR